MTTSNFMFTMIIAMTLLLVSPGQNFSSLAMAEDLSEGSSSGDPSIPVIGFRAGGATLSEGPERREVVKLGSEDGLQGVNFLSSATRNSEEVWPKEPSYADVQNNATNTVLYEDYKSEIQSFLMDDDSFNSDGGIDSDSDSDGDSENSLGLDDVDSTIDPVKITKTTRRVCIEREVQANISAASVAIDKAVASLKSAQGYPNCIAKSYKLVKWMQKWLKDLDTMLKARDFRRSPNKLRAVTNNIGYVQKLSLSPAYDFIGSAINHVNVLKGIVNSLSNCLVTKMTSIPKLSQPRIVSIPSGTPYTSMEAYQNVNHASIDANNVKITLDDSVWSAVRTRSKDTFESGIFSATIRCPASYGGIIIGFYLYSSDVPEQGEGIMMEFLGNQSDQVRATTVKTSGMRGNMVYLGWNCSQESHRYTLIWDAETISWLADGDILRTIIRNDPNGKDSWADAKSLRLYTSVRRYYGWGAGEYNSKLGPFEVYFSDIEVTSPIEPRTRPQMPYWPIATFPLAKYGIDYCRETVSTIGSELVIPWGIGECWGGRVISPRRYNFGTFSADIMCPKGNSSGLVTAFYLSSYEGSYRFRIQDEIDFEFLGKDSHIVQASVFVNGKMYAAFTINLGFDCSKDFHTYAIKWSSSKIEWYVDNELKYVYLNNGVKPYPMKPAYLYESVWVQGGSWSGKYYGVDIPYFARYRNIQITSPGS